ncbi:MAG: D-alanyl-D-alanine endopeptidase [Methylophilales bacterium]|nr:D-alanyl-D-alanine endopeptidase [Methylophilales bacterium]
MRRFTTLFCCLLVLAFSAAPVEAARTKHDSATVKNVVKHKIRHKVRLKTKHTNPQRIIRTIRASKNYHAPAQQPEAVFAASTAGSLQLASSKALIVNQETGETLYAKGTDIPTPIASITKLMTAMVMLDMHLPMEEMLSVSDADVDTLKNTTSRLRVGTELSRAEMLKLALMSSENRAASALARTTPIGMAAFIAAMNRKAAELGMKNSHFADPTGLNSENISTAEDLVKMVKAAYSYPDIRTVTTTASYDVPIHGLRRLVEFRNTNVLVRNGTWDIGLSKTGYISEAGRCLVMQAQIAAQPLIIVLLDSYGKNTRIGDAQRIKKWMQSGSEWAKRRLS